MTGHFSFRPLNTINVFEYRQWKETCLHKVREIFLFVLVMILCLIERNLSNTISFNKELGHRDDFGKAVQTSKDNCLLEDKYHKRTARTKHLSSIFDSWL